MSCRNLLARLARASDRGSERECRCPPEPGGESSGGKLLGRALCTRCDGACMLYVVERVVMPDRRELSTAEYEAEKAEGVPS